MAKPVMTELLIKIGCSNINPPAALEYIIRRLTILIIRLATNLSSLMQLAREPIFVFQLTGNRSIDSAALITQNKILYPTHRTSYNNLYGNDFNNN
ncbi:MAG: hypothetical protein EBZ77_00545, partial [Chitinophagia bacterium]|nr:hypothetical protein [Chitinophagia bacterium]